MDNKSLVLAEPKTRRVRVVDCPECGETTVVARPEKYNGELFRITTCNYCYSVINNETHPGYLTGEF